MSGGGRPLPSAGKTSAVTPDDVTIAPAYFSFASSPIRSIEVPAPVDSSPAFE
jgi:hypothetical protein